MQERRTQLLCLPVVLCLSCVQVILCLNGVEEHAIGSVMAYTSPESVECSSSVMGCTDHLTVNTRGVEDLGANVWIRAVQDQVRTNLRRAVCRTCCCSYTHTHTWLSQHEHVEDLESVCSSPEPRVSRQTLAVGEDWASKADLLARLRGVGGNSHGFHLGAMPRYFRTCRWRACRHTPSSVVALCTHSAHRIALSSFRMAGGAGQVMHSASQSSLDRLMFPSPPASMRRSRRQPGDTCTWIDRCGNGGRWTTWCANGGLR